MNKFNSYIIIENFFIEVEKDFYRSELYGDFRITIRSAKENNFALEKEKKKFYLRGLFNK